MNSSNKKSSSESDLGTSGHQESTETPAITVHSPEIPTWSGQFNFLSSPLRTSESPSKKALPSIAPVEPAPVASNNEPSFDVIPSSQQIALQNPAFLRLQQDPFFRNGFLYQLAGNLDAAATCYARSIQLNPSAEACTFLGETLYRLGETDSALFQLKRALEINPEYSLAWTHLGSYLIEKFQYEEAIDCLKKALKSKLLQGRSLVLFHLARAYVCKGLFVAAEKTLEEALLAEPQFPAAQLLKGQLAKHLH